jgi:hypothetical protein
MENFYVYHTVEDANYKILNVNRVSAFLFLYKEENLLHVFLKCLILT